MMHISSNSKGAAFGFIRSANAYARAGSVSTQQANQIIHMLPYSAQAIKASL